jgi:hypothetical protein
MIQTSQAPRRAAIGVGLAAVVIAGLSGCGLVRTINNVRHGIDSNRAAIKAFTQGLKSGEAVAFAATYVTTGGSPVTVTYAVRPPADVTFMQSGGGTSASKLDLVSNSSGEFSCTAIGSSPYACQKLGKAQAVAQNQIADIYTPAHWVTFLEAFSIAAGFAGDKVTNSTLTVNGFAMKCVDFTAKGVKGTSTICSTSQNILGYVKVAGNATSFELKSYTSNPSASLFQLPAGAKITSGN